MKPPPAFVTTQWLSYHLEHKDLRIVDASWYLDNAGRDPLAEFEKAHIPGALYFDLDQIADTSSALPHMVAAPKRFSALVGALGISENNVVVVYDSSGLFSAARVWWNFSIMGAESCFVLEGGLPKWLKEKRPTQSGPANPVASLFKAKAQKNAVVSAAQLLDHINVKADPAIGQVVDVRSAQRFYAQAPEPRAGLRRGHMPNSFNLPYRDLIKDGVLRSPEEIRAAVEKAGVDLDQPIVSSCGSGVTAALLNLALRSLGIKSMRVYDGSWAEWGADPDLPVVATDDN